MMPALRRIHYLAAALLLASGAPVCAQVTVTLTAPANGATFAPGSNITLSANATAPSGYTLSKVEFFRDTTLIGTDTSAPYSVTWNNVGQGNYTLTARATAIKKNQPDQTATSSPRNILVTVAPTVTLISPPGGVLPSAHVSLSATANDSDGTIAMVRFHYLEFYGADSGVVTVSQAPYSAMLPLQPSCCLDENGNYNYLIWAEAIDNQGATATTLSIDFWVPRIAIVTPAQNATFTAPASIFIEPYVVNGDGMVSSVDYYNGSTFIGRATSPPFTLTWTGVPQGNYSIRAYAFDAASSPVNVTVNAAVAELYLIHVDHLNTPRLVANQSGQTVWRWDQQEPFGVNVPDENPSALGTFELPLRFPGQYFDKETNLHYNYFRDYDPGIGRYVEGDPIGLRGGLNTYAYVGGNPMSLTDPSGLKSRVCCTRIPGIGRLGFRHCYIETENGGRTTYGLHQGGVVQGDLGGAPNCGQVLPNVGMDFGGACGGWKDDPCTDDCVKKAASAYPNPSSYDLLGSNSNTFASVVAGKCGLQKPPNLTQGNIPGWGAAPATAFPGVPQIPPIWQPACPAPTPWGDTR